MEHQAVVGILKRDYRLPSLAAVGGEGEQGVGGVRERRWLCWGEGRSLWCGEKGGEE